MVVYCDESGIDRRDGARRTGWSPKGVAPWTFAVFERGKRFHILPAITSTGLLDVFVYKGHTTADGFFEWLRTALLPKMNRFPGLNSILVMDNASWHTNAYVKKLCNDFGGLIWYFATVFTRLSTPLRLILGT
jgi:hypothetical protein